MSAAASLRCSLLACLLAAAAVAPDASADVLAGRFSTLESTNTVSRFTAAQSGDVAPVAVLGGPATTLNSAGSLFHDAPMRELWISDFEGQQIAIFDVDAAGATAPKRRFSSPLMGQPRSARIMANRSEVAVISINCCISFFDAQASGSVSPLRRIAWGGVSGSQTQLNNPSGFDYAPSRDRLFVGDYRAEGSAFVGRVLRFNRTAETNAAPHSILEGPQTLLGSYVPAIVVDEVAGEMFVLTPDAATGAGAMAILVFGVDDAGNVAPRRRIAGPSTGLVNALAMVLDQARGELVVASGAFGATPALRVFPRNGDGNLAPLRSISGAATGVTGSSGWYSLAVVPARERIFSSGFELP